MNNVYRHSISMRRILEFLLMIPARIWILRAKPHIVVVAGTLAKTRFKREFAKVLKGISVNISDKGYNTTIGLPLAILQVPAGQSSFAAWGSAIVTAWVHACRLPKTTWLIVEFGVSEKGEMKKLLQITGAIDIAILTPLVPSASVSDGRMLDIVAEELVQLIDCAHEVVYTDTDERLRIAVAKAVTTRTSVVTHVAILTNTENAALTELLKAYRKIFTELVGGE